MSEPGGRGRFLDFFPPGANQSFDQQWTVSRVLFRRAVALSPVRIIHLGDALPRRSSALTRALALMTLPRLTKRRRREERFGRVTLLQRPYSSLLPEGLASPPVTRLSRVGSYPTISPLPVRAEAALSSKAT